MKFKNLYKARILDFQKTKDFEILYLAGDFENACAQAKYIGRYRAAELDTDCEHKCKDVKILNVELVTIGVLLPNEIHTTND